MWTPTLGRDLKGIKMDFLTTKGIAASIEKIIRNANDFIVIISPYVKIDKTYIDRLLEAEQKNVEIILVFGKEDMRDFEKDKFQSFQNINIYFLANLHAKCYLNENTALITSMNLYGYSEENNREMGIEISRSENYGLYEDILKESKSIKNSAEEYNLWTTRDYNSNWRDDRNYRHPNYGYCIRCREKIDLDTQRPLCNDCYQIWSQFGNIDYRENYCHKCGKEITGWDEAIDYAHPLCHSCWSNSDFF